MRSRKGISPIIASVLIILVVISLASTYTVWSSRVFGSVASAGEETVSKTSRALFSNFDIQGAADTRIFIKNTGTSELSSSALQVFFDVEPLAFAADFDVLERDRLGTITLSQLWTLGAGDHDLRISAGSFQDSNKIIVSPARGVVGDWRFEEDSGTVVNDASGKGNHAALGNGTSATVPARTEGKIGKAVRLDGAWNYVDVSNKMIDDLKGQGQITVEAWFNRDPSVAPGRDFIIGDHWLGLWISLNSNTAKPQFQQKVGSACGGGWSTQTLVDYNVTLAGWTHLLVSYDGSNQRFYINGALLNNTPASGAIPDCTTQDPKTFWIGTDRTDSSGEPHFPGMIDEVRVYTSAYAPDELYTLTLKS
ncbi:MAG: hypothetical protein HY366_02370 [Candidatus Aenigmarchaeota archaeon]|nr:hypothetical protein [Candidatus Aenigmarchaeota archaeon]